MQLCVVAVGSNVDPESNVPAALAALLELAPTLWVSRFTRTEPVGLIDEGGAFLNGAVAFETDLPREALVAALHGIEEALGRDRSAPGRQARSRPMDLDLVRYGESGEIPAEPYARPFVLELLAALGLPEGGGAPTLGPGVPLRLGDQTFGEAPGTLRAKETR